MGTTLTGTTPQDTYDSLIKVTDNGPLSGTAKYLSDGLGNDSALALSTGNIGIGTTSPSQPLVVFKSNAADDIGQIIQQGANGTAAFLNIVGNNDAGASFNRITSSTSGGTAHWQIGGGGTASTMVLLTGGSERMRITSAGNVGIGTGSPQSILDVRKLSTNLGTTSELGLLISNTGVLGQYAQIGFGYSESTCAAVIAGVITSASGATTSNLVFATRSGTGGSTAPVERMRVTADGLTFNGDTAAANALDDYEEGTWTPTFNAAITISGTPTGKYTKVGRSVYATCSFTYTALTGADIAVSGLPFTNAAVRQATAVAFAGVARTTNQFFGTVVEASATTFYIEVVNSASGVSLTAHASCWYQV
jgi:hypothetical protein